MEARNPIESAAAVARGAERRAAPWIETAARLGYAAKGVVYIMIGAIAARVAFGGRGDVEGWNGSLNTLRDEPLGGPMLWLIGIGLLGYAAWRFVTAIRQGSFASNSTKPDSTVCDTWAFVSIGSTQVSNKFSATPTRIL